MNEQGWFKVSLAKEGLDEERWSPKRWLRMLSEVEAGRWEHIVQRPEFSEMHEERWGDRRRLQAVIGDATKRLELLAGEDFQALHDRLFNVPTAASRARADAASVPTDQQPKTSQRRPRGMRSVLPGDRRFSSREIDKMTKWTRIPAFDRAAVRCSLPERPAVRMRTARVVSGLASQPGCERQGQHFDWNFDPEHGRTAFLSFFMPLTHSTVLHLWR